MIAADLARIVPGAKERKTGEWEAPCPLHGGKSGRSFTFRDAEDGTMILAHCRAGCETDAVLGVLGKNLADLYTSMPKPMDRATALRIRAEKGLEGWRLVMLTENCICIRTLEKFRDEVLLLLDAYREIGHEDPDDVEPLWGHLQVVYHALSGLEHDFERLNSKSQADHLTVWREHQKPICENS